MTRTIACVLVGLLAVASTCCAAGKYKEIVDPAKVADDPDFLTQGEYLGRGLLNGEQTKVGAQVIARGNGEFEVWILGGGLPGAGWERGDTRFAIQGKRDGKVTKLTGEGLTGQIVGETLDLANADGKTKFELKQIERKSPTLGQKAPEGAMVLFDGTSDAHFEGDHLTELGTLVSGTTSKPGFGDIKLHLEFRLSYMPDAKGQARSNSGVYLHDCYEVQVLDSFGLEGKDNECGGLYSVGQPVVNMCLPPLQWQTYDIDFTAPKYEGDKKVKNARITVKHNGVTIHDDVELPKATPGRKPEGPAPRPFHLQGHGNHVHYQNIWVEKQ